MSDLKSERIYVPGANWPVLFKYTDKLSALTPKNLVTRIEVNYDSGVDSFPFEKVRPRQIDSLHSCYLKNDVRTALCLDREPTVGVQCLKQTVEYSVTRPLNQAKYGFDKTAVLGALNAFRVDCGFKPRAVKKWRPNMTFDVNPSAPELIPKFLSLNDELAKILKPTKTENSLSLSGVLKKPAKFSLDGLVEISKDEITQLPVGDVLAHIIAPPKSSENLSYYAWLFLWPNIKKNRTMAEVAVALKEPYDMQTVYDALHCRLKRDARSKI